ncbi:serine/threonine-protein kinase LMTK1 isoform X2 [Amblyraja radiata]|uniref:serine/threonine-protein kinase LMTK1 isoform X2 n=1 Tax=Amblyraja radiata TaxID=386614 RepID=UPI001403E084|nr:serine/threonine-protein kinase LMTK1 isoform X2 [Amblyraja radiata]
MWSYLYLALMLMSGLCQPSLAFSSHFDPGHWTSGQRGDGTPIGELTWSSSLAVIAVSFSGLFTFIFLMLACLCCKKGDIGFKEPTSAVKHFSQKEFENNAGEDDPGEISPHTTSSLQNGPEVYILPLTEVSLPVSSQPSTRPGHFLHPADLGRQSLLYLKEVGHGWFGKVFLGEVNISRNSCQVVVKELKVGASIQDQMRFLEEVQPHRSLQHPNLLQCLSQLTEVTPYLLVMEFCQLGDLKGYLRTHSAADELAPDPSTLQRMACEITSGLQHLHKHHYIHSDLALRNCLLSADLTVKLGDYGLSHNKYKQDYLVTPDQLWIPLRWIAPELIDDVHGNLLVVDQTKISNIWSLGVTLWELFEFGNQPYHRCSDKEVLTYTIKEQQLKLQKPLLNLPLSERWYEVMQFCWLQPEQRPTADEVHLLLSYLCAKASSDVEEEFEKRWNAMKPGGSSCRRATQLSSFPLLEQFGQDGFHTEVDDVLTVTETSQGLNFEYKWDRKPVENFQPSPVGLVQAGSQYQEIYFPSSASGRLSLSVSPVCSNSFYESKQQCSLPQSLEPPGVVPVISAHSPSVTGEYYIRIEEPSDCNMELDYTMCSYSPECQPESSWRGFQARDTMMDNGDNSPTISLTMEPLLGHGLSGGQGSWEREPYFTRSKSAQEFYHTFPGDEANQSLLANDSWRGGDSGEKGFVDPLGVSPLELAPSFGDPGSLFIASYDQLDETGLANGYQPAAAAPTEPALDNAKPLPSRDPWHHDITPQPRESAFEAEDGDLLTSEVVPRALSGGFGGEMAPRSLERDGQDSGFFGGKIQADISDMDLSKMGILPPLSFSHPLEPLASKENGGCEGEEGCREGSRLLTVGGCGHPLSSPEAQRQSPAELGPEGRGDLLPARTQASRDEEFVDPLSGLVVKNCRSAANGGETLPDLDITKPSTDSSGHRDRPESPQDFAQVEIAVTDLTIVSPPSETAPKGHDISPVKTLSSTSFPETDVGSDDETDVTSEIFTDLAPESESCSDLLVATSHKCLHNKVVGTPDSLESLDIPSTGSSCDTFSPTSHYASLQPRAADSGYDTENFESPEFVLKEPAEQKVGAGIGEGAEDFEPPSLEEEEEKSSCRDSAYFSDYDAESERCPAAPELDRDDLLVEMHVASAPPPPVNGSSQPNHAVEMPVHAMGEESQQRCNPTQSLAKLESTDIEEISDQAEIPMTTTGCTRTDPSGHPAIGDKFDHRGKDGVTTVDYYVCRQMFDERVGFGSESGDGLVQKKCNSERLAALPKKGGHYKAPSGCIFDGTELILEEQLSEPGNQRGVGFHGAAEVAARKFQPYSLNVEERLERCIVPKMQLVQLTLELPPLTLSKEPRPPFIGEEGEEEEGEGEEEEEEESDDSDEELRIYNIQEDSEEDAPAVPIVVTEKDDGRNLRSLLKLPNLMCDTYCDDLERKKKAVSFYDDVTVYLFDQESPTGELSEQNIPDVDPARPHLPDHLQDKSTNISVVSERQKGTSDPSPRNFAEESGGFEWDDDFPLVSVKSSLVTEGSVLPADPASAGSSPGSEQGPAHQTRFSRFTVSPATLSRFSITHVSDSDIGPAGGSAERGERE